MKHLELGPFRRFRRNADPGERELQRRWFEGDHAAGLHYVILLYRTGQLTVQRALELGEIVPEALAQADPVLAERLGYLFTGSRPGTLGGVSRFLGGEFFPGYTDVSVCPRGHRIGQKHVSWTHVELDEAYREVRGINLRGQLIVEGFIYEHGDGPAVNDNYLYCSTATNTQGKPVAWGEPNARTCNACWRAPGREAIEFV